MTFQAPLKGFRFGTLIFKGKILTEEEELYADLQSTATFPSIACNRSFIALVKDTPNPSLAQLAISSPSRALSSYRHADQPTHTMPYYAPPSELTALPRKKKKDFCSKLKLCCFFLSVSKKISFLCIV